MKKITFLISGDKNLILNNYSLFFRELAKVSIIRIIDVADLIILKKKTEYKKTRNKNIPHKYLKIKTLKQFKQFIKNNKENLFCLLSQKFEEFLIFNTLKKNKTKLISFDIVNTNNLIKKNYLLKKKLSLKIISISRYLFLILFYLKLVANFDYSFFCKKVEFKKNFFFQVLNKKFLGKIKEINSIFIYKNKNVYSKKKYIVFLDCFFHPEIYSSKNKIEKRKENEYFVKLKQLLETLEARYKKKFIVKPHPKSPIGKYKKYFDKNKLDIKTNSYKLIDQSHMVICSNSSLINYIFSTNTNFLYLKWKYLSQYEKNFTKSWQKKYLFGSIDLDTKKIITPKKIILNKFSNNNVIFPHTTLLNFT